MGRGGDRVSQGGLGLVNFCGLFLGQAQGLVVFFALYLVLGSSWGQAVPFLALLPYAY